MKPRLADNLIPPRGGISTILVWFLVRSVWDAPTWLPNALGDWLYWTFMLLLFLNFFYALGWTFWGKKIYLNQILNK